MYQSLLKGFKRMRIPVKDFPLFTVEEDFRHFNFHFNELCLSFQIPPFQFVSHVILTENGFEFDLQELRKYLCSYFHVQENTAVLELKVLEKELKENGIQNLLTRFPSMKRAFNRYQLVRYMPSKAKKATIHKAKRKEFVGKTKKDMKLLKDLITNPQIYSRIKIEHFDLEKLRLYLAYLVMDYRETSQDKNEKEQALEYLKSYIEENEELVVKDFRFRSVNPRTKVLKREYSIQQIKMYVKRYEKKESNDIEYYPYSFFDYDPKKGDMIFDTIIQFAQEKGEKLDELLRRKIELYQSLPYKSIKVGADSFSGYMGFALENGYVILDKLFDNLAFRKVASYNAIYIIKEEHFERITRMSKTEAIKEISAGKLPAIRIIHSDHFEKKVKQYVLVD